MVNNWQIHAHGIGKASLIILSATCFFIVDRYWDHGNGNNMPQRVAVGHRTIKLRLEIMTSLSFLGLPTKNKKKCRFPLTVPSTG